jgi:hypothetical protein
VPEAARHAPAIFLCPERIWEIYPTLVRIGDNMRQLPRLGSNPACVSLRLTLLHELGHHFFPVHRAGAGRFLCEGLANRFCRLITGSPEQALLLYKSWYMQPPEYSAYRPLDVLCEADDDCRAAVAECFNGTLDGWAAMPDKAELDLDRRLGASLTMARAADGGPCAGLSEEIRLLVSPANRWFPQWGDGIFIHHRKRSDGGHIPADLVLDLYQKQDLTLWITRPGVPDGFWGSWGYGNQVCWPEDNLPIGRGDAGRWIELYDQRPYHSAATVLEGTLNKRKDLRDAPAVRACLARILNDPGSRPQRGQLHDLGWIRRMLADPQTV